MNPVRTYLAFEIIIRDSGFGIKKENLDKVFGACLPDEENNRQNYGGTGIDLR